MQLEEEQSRASLGGVGQVAPGTEPDRALL